jgi:hypothetical protein
VYTKHPSWPCLCSLLRADSVDLSFVILVYFILMNNSALALFKKTIFRCI